MIEAAGGAIWRSGSVGLEVLVVHRPRYDDWSLPKGKLEADETHLQAALREVTEETGLVCAAGPELREVRYVDRSGEAKRVRYWAMTVASGTFEANREVDDVRWIPVGEARSLLSYAADATLVAELDELGLTD